jgi:hypothetical protein
MRCRSIWPLALVAAALSACADMPWLRWDNIAPSKEAVIKPPPGALNDAVTQASIRRTICTTGWSASVRPPASFLGEAKSRLMKEAALPASDAPKYEVDFFIPLGLGGHPRKHDNLWLQPVDGPWSARTKDRLEGKLRRMVCSGEITLHEARDAMRTDWKLAARYYLSDRELLGPAD